VESFRNFPFFPSSSSAPFFCLFFGVFDLDPIWDQCHFGPVTPVTKKQRIFYEVKGIAKLLFGGVKSRILICF